MGQAKRKLSGSEGCQVCVIKPRGDHQSQNLAASKRNSMPVSTCSSLQNWEASFRTRTKNSWSCTVSFPPHNSSEEADSIFYFIPNSSTWILRPGARLISLTAVSRRGLGGAPSESLNWTFPPRLCCRVFWDVLHGALGPRSLCFCCEMLIFYESVT